MKGVFLASLLLAALAESLQFPPLPSSPRPSRSKVALSSTLPSSSPSNIVHIVQDVLSVPPLLLLNTPSLLSRRSPSDLQVSILEVTERLAGVDSSYHAGVLRLRRYLLLCSLLSADEDCYFRTVSFMISSSTIDFERWEAPNLQRFPPLPLAPAGGGGARPSSLEDYVAPDRKVVIERKDREGVVVTEDSVLPDIRLPLSVYDKVLLAVFRYVVGEESGQGALWETKGMEGLVEQARSYMIYCNSAEDSSAASERQSQMVKNVLATLMGPIKHVYRLFMAGIVPARVAEVLGKPEWKNKQVFEGGVFYAPYLTSLVTPLFFGFLVGNSSTCRREDGTRGAVLVEKCRFLELSNCKGICLHQCKKPAEEFFKHELGVDLYVQPNFTTGECQWSWGEEAKDPKQDETWPKGCLNGCIDRKKLAAKELAALEREP